MIVKDQAKIARAQGIDFRREYQEHVIHRARYEKTFTVWRRGKCHESGIKTFIAALDWIEENKCFT